MNMKKFLGIPEDKKERSIQLKEASSCILCKSDESLLLSDICRYSIRANNLICKKCGLIYIDQKDSVIDVQGYYENFYRLQYNLEKLDSIKYAELKAKKAKFLGKYVFPNSKVLEIGCANGILLNELRKQRQDIHLFGVEPARDLAAQAARNFGIDVFNGMFEGFISESKKFDFIILDHVLEHFKDPLTTLIKVRNILKDGGVVYIEVPDIKQPYGDLENNFFQHVHLHNFSYKTLQILLKLSGFDFIESNLDICIGCFIKKGRVYQAENINFELEGDNYLQIIKFLRLYQNYHKFITNSGSQKKFYMEEVLKIDMDLEKRMQKMYLDVLKEKIDNCMAEKDEEAFRKEISSYISGYANTFIASAKILRSIVKKV